MHYDQMLELVDSFELTGDITPLEATADGDVLKMNIRLKPYAAYAYIVQ